MTKEEIAEKYGEAYLFVKTIDLHRRDFEIEHAGNNGRRDGKWEDKWIFVTHARIVNLSGAYIFRNKFGDGFGSGFHWWEVPDEFKLTLEECFRLSNMLDDPFYSIHPMDGERYRGKDGCLKCDGGAIILRPREEMFNCFKLTDYNPIYNPMGV